MKIKLHDIANELNVGISSLLEVLRKKSKDIENNPNSRLEQEDAELLRNEFKNEKIAKANIILSKEERKTNFLQKEENPELLKTQRHMISYKEKKELADKIKKILVTELTSDAEGWYKLVSLAPKIKKNGIDFTKYGYEKLRFFIEEIFGPSLEKRTEPTEFYLRIKEKAVEKPYVEESQQHSQSEGTNPSSKIYSTEHRNYKPAPQRTGMATVPVIDQIKEDGFNEGDTIRLASKLGILEGTIIAFTPDSIKIRPYNYPYGKFATVKGVSISEWMPVIESQQNQFIPPTSITKRDKTVQNQKKEEQYSHNYVSKGIFNFLGLKEIEQRVAELKNQGEITQAIDLIDHSLKNPEIFDKIRGSLLVLKAQTLSAQKWYDQAIEAYQKVVDFKKTHNANANDISHNYVQLAQLQSLYPELRQKAIHSAKQALRFFEGNKSAQIVLENLENPDWVPYNTEATVKEFMIEDIQNQTISELLREDMKLHKFASKEILAHNGEPTYEIAKALYKEALETKAYIEAEKYPLFLEIAKAFQMFPPGSYDYKEFNTILAFYAVLKGNYLYTTFKKKLERTEGVTEELVSLMDSAYSYYMESLSLLDGSKKISVLSVLTNCLWMNVALNLRQQLYISEEIPTVFSQLFEYCIKHHQLHLQKVGWKTVVDVGSRSPKTWNNLCKIKNGTGNLYGLMEKRDLRQRAYAIIATIINKPLDTTLKPGEYIRQAFDYSRQQAEALLKLGRQIAQQPLNPKMLSPVEKKWVNMQIFTNLFNDTDMDSYETASKVISNLHPYVDRDEKERGGILQTTSTLIQDQLNYISENTTYYGRVIFSPILTNWYQCIQTLRNMEASKILPVLEIYPDPEYITEVNGENLINLIIKNSGSATAEKYEVYIKINNKEGEFVGDLQQLLDQEVSANRKSDLILPLSDEFNDYDYLDLEVHAVPVYQGNRCNSSVCRFSVQREPNTSFEYEDIPWQYTKIPVHQLFKGREKLLEQLEKHYLSHKRDYSYILYGLTRTGKSSILEFLADRLDWKELKLPMSANKNVCTIKWDLSEVANYSHGSEIWDYFVGRINKDISGKVILNFHEKSYRYKHFTEAIHKINKAGFYPVFFVDEFGYFPKMIDDGILTEAFLHTMRQLAFDGKASFIFAGTYEIKKLLQDEKYGITGQLVNTIEYQVGEIDEEEAESLMKVMEPNFSFSKEAIERIHNLSGDIPYFVQIICRSCAEYACELKKKRSVIGFAELEKIVDILTGEYFPKKDSAVTDLPSGIFQNNMETALDPPHYKALLSSICYFNRNNKFNPRGVSHAELQQLWAEHDIKNFNPLLADAIQALKERGIIKQVEVDQLPTYQITVDLFRRWWSKQHPDISLELSSIPK